MSLNEILIFFVLFLIGSTCGVAFGSLAASKRKGLLYGLLRGGALAIGVTLLILFVISVKQVWDNSDSVGTAILSAMGVSLLYGLGASVVSGTSAWLACFFTYRVLV